MTRQIDLSPPAPWPERRDAAMPAHDAAMQRARVMLGACTVPRQAQWWTDLKHAERVTLVKHAGLAPVTVELGWVRIGVEQRRLILEAVERAASWAQKLQGLLA